jgi:anti-sigma-K factor RskA
VKQYSREELFELAAAYAVGATTQEESAAVEAALPTSPELADEVASFREAATVMVQQQSMQPSASVRSKFLEGISQSKTAALPLTAPPRPSRMPLIAMGFALAASIIFAVTYKLENSQLLQREADLADRLAVAEGEAQKRHEQLNSILEADGTLRLVHLRTIGADQGPGIQFYWNEKQRRGMAHAFRLKPAPTGRAYQLWLIVNGKPVSAGVFNSDADGHALFMGVELPATAAGVTDVLVTEEPVGGSPGPTTTPFMGGKVTAPQ